jgi:serpin B
MRLGFDFRVLGGGVLFCLAACGRVTTAAPVASSEPARPSSVVEKAPAPPDRVADEPATEPEPDVEPDAEAPAASPAPKTFAHMNNAFGQRLFGVLRREPGNLLFSPVSVSTALVMTYAGAGGDTAREMEQALSLSLSGEALHAELSRTMKLLSSSTLNGGPDLSIANRLWPNRDLLLEPSFVQLAQRFYGAAPETLDFAQHEAARQRINAWVEQQTKQMVPALLAKGTVSATDKLVLTNAVYFKGKWSQSFDAQNTRPEPFTPEGEAAITTPLMHRTLRARYGEASDAQVLELGYRAAGKGPRIAMDLILPKDPAGLAAVEGNLANGIAPYLSSLSPSEVDVTLPRFKLSWSAKLNDSLQRLGMRRAFVDGADFSGLSNAGLYISLVQHQAVIEVNEEGTKAAAATAVVMTAKAAPLTMTFRADRPFLFLLRDVDSGTVLFVGRFAKPS